MTEVELKKARAAFYNQKSQAKRDGIGWELTFEQWLQWWGDDLARRGNGRDQLQMQRYDDKGPYALGNIKKGTPKQNKSTWAKASARRREERERREHQQFVNALWEAHENKG